MIHKWEGYNLSLSMSLVASEAKHTLMCSELETVLQTPFNRLNTQFEQDKEEVWDVVQTLDIGLSSSEVGTFFPAFLSLKLFSGHLFFL